MAAIIHPLLTLLASLSRQELAQQVPYLKTENRFLRSNLPDRIQLNNQERRRLVKHGKKLGARIKDLISIASYSTFRKWVRAMEDGSENRPANKSGKKGRPRVDDNIAARIIKMKKWTTQHARNFAMYVDEHGLRCELVQRDNDAKYVDSFDSVFKSMGGKMKRTTHQSPNLQAFVERVVQTIKHEILNGFCIVHEQLLDHILSRGMDWYNNRRCHSERDNRPPVRDDVEPEVIDLATRRIECFEELGGQLKSYRASSKHRRQIFP